MSPSNKLRLLRFCLVVTVGLVAAGCSDSAAGHGSTGGLGEGGAVSGGSSGEDGDDAGGATGDPPLPPECSEDKNCSPQEYCNPLNFQCESKVEDCGVCSVDAACSNDGGVCLDYAQGGRFCAKLCLSDFGCDPCFECRDVADNGDMHCVPLSATCEQACPCNEDVECPEGQFCSDVTHDCADGCVEDGQCRQGQVCDRARCKAPCAVVSDCPEGTDCVEGHCEVPGGCVSSRDCEAQHYCDVETRLCRSGCQINNDCGNAGLQCEDNACVEKGCERHYECGHGQVCRAPQCEAAPPEYCAQCDPDADGACGGAPNLCATFQDDDGNELGSFCLIACDDDDPGGLCPQGYQCQEIEVQEGDVRRLCARACYRAPVGL